MYTNLYRSQEYRNNDVMGASPLRLIIMAYDVAIRACDQKDFEKSSQAICLLRDALNFDYPEVTVGLFRLYQWCLDCIRRGDYAAAQNTLTELRDAWQATEANLNLPGPSAAVVTAGRTGIGA